MSKKIIGVTVGTPISPSKFLDEHLAGVDEALDGILNLQELFKNGGGSIYGIAGKIYPIGSIYMSVNDTSPASLFGGTWEQLKDRFLLGADGTYAAGATGGSADAKLINHNHALISYGNGSVIAEKGQLFPGTDGTYGRIIKTEEEGGRFADDMKAVGRFVTTSPKGLNSPDKEIIYDSTGANMPPYLAVYMWKRTA